MRRAAVVLLAYVEEGPDEGWTPFTDGRGHITWLLARSNLNQPGMRIPLSEMPPL